MRINLSWCRIILNSSGKLVITHPRGAWWIAFYPQAIDLQESCRQETVLIQGSYEINLIPIGLYLNSSDY